MTTTMMIMLISGRDISGGPGERQTAIGDTLKTEHPHSDVDSTLLK